VAPGDKVGFIIDRIVNFTNVCEASCVFCAFHARAGRIEAYELTLEEILAKVEELAAIGGTQVMLQGGLHPRHTLETYLAMVRAVKNRFPEIALHSFSPAELVYIARRSGVALDEAVKSLKDAGLDSVPGASDLLVDRIRNRVSPKKITRDDWCRVMDALCRHGLKSSATMTYGMGETLAERIDHLRVVRAVQDRTGILRAFIPWSFQEKNTKLESSGSSGFDYLKTVAVSRIILNNFDNIQASWVTQGGKVAQLALLFGANDMGSTMIEENVVAAAGVFYRINKEEIIGIIKDAGFTPSQRDNRYNICQVKQK